MQTATFPRLRMTSLLVVLVTTCATQAMAVPFTPDLAKQSVKFGYAPGRYANEKFSEQTKAIAVADLNGDGFVDIVVANGGLRRTVINSGGVGEESLYGGDYIALNDGAGVFLRLLPLDLGEEKSYALAVGDLNGDQKIDILVGCESGLCIPFVNDGSAQFTKGTPFVGANTNLVAGIAIGRVDDDSDHDVVIARSGGIPSVELWLNDATGVFSQGSALEGFSGWDVAIGDLNHDQKNDIAAVDRGQIGFVWFNGGNGAFNSINTGSFNSGTSKWDKVDIADFNNDGKQDLIVGALRQSLSFEIRSYNTTTAQFVKIANSDDISLGNNSYGGIGDLNGDNVPDIVMTGYFQSTALINNGYALINNGTGGFTSLLVEDFQALAANNPAGGPHSGSLYESTESLAVVDVNGDGKNDVVRGKVLRGMTNNPATATKGGAQNDILLNATVAPASTSTAATFNNIDASTLAVDGSFKDIWRIRVQDPTTGTNDGLDTTITHITFSVLPQTADIFEFDYVEGGGGGTGLHIFNAASTAMLETGQTLFISLYDLEDGVPAFAGGGLLSGCYQGYWTAWDAHSGSLDLDDLLNHAQVESGKICVLGGRNTQTLAADFDFNSLADIEWVLNDGVADRSAHAFAQDGTLQFLCNSTAAPTAGGARLFTLKAKVKASVARPSNLDELKLRISARFHTKGSKLNLTDGVLLKANDVSLEVTGTTFRVVELPPSVSSGVPFSITIERVDAFGNRDLDYGTGVNATVKYNGANIGAMTFTQGLGTAEVTLGVAAGTSAALQVVDGSGNVMLSTSPVQVFEAGAPSVQSISASTGLARGGETVTLVGLGFLGATVTLDGVAAQTTVSDNNHLSFVTPSERLGNIAGSRDVVLKIQGSSASLELPFTYFPCIVTSISPNIAKSNDTNQTLTITGRGFWTSPSSGPGVVSQVALPSGAANGTAITVVNDTKLTIRAPKALPHHSGFFVDVNVTNSYGTGTLVKGLGWKPLGTHPAYTRIRDEDGDSVIELGSTPTLTFYGTGLFPVGANTVEFFSSPTSESTRVSLGTAPVLQATGTSLTVQAPLFAKVGKAWPSLSLDGKYATQAPAITQVRPPVGRSDGGDTVTISGYALDKTSAVYFGSERATIVAKSANEVVVYTPAVSAGTVDVIVVGGPYDPATASNISEDVLTSAFTFENTTPQTRHTPVVLSWSPKTGHDTGGINLTVEGYNLRDVSSVTVGGQAAEIVSTSPETLVFKVPNVIDLGIGGKVDIVIGSGSNSTTIEDGFDYYLPVLQYLTGLSVTHCSNAGGLPLVINGYDLSRVTSVTFGGVDAQISFTQTSTVNVTTPALTPGIKDVTVSATMNGATVTKTLAAAFTVYPVNVPIIWAISPTSGGSDGNDLITVSGDYLSNITSGSFGGVAATVVAKSTTSVILKTPAGLPDGFLNVTVSDGTNTSTLPSVFRSYPVNKPVIFNVAPTSMSVYSLGTLTLNGAYLSGIATAQIGSTPATIISSNSFSQANIAIPSGLAPGTYSVTVTRNADTFTLAGALTLFEETPTLTSVSSPRASQRGDEEIVIAGTSLLNVSTLTIGGVAAEILSRTDTALTVKTAVMTSGAKAIVATVGSKSASLNGQFSVYPADIPIVWASSENPPRGSSAGGDSFTLIGDYLMNNIEEVKVGGILAPNFLVYAAGTRLSVTTGPMQPGPLDITVKDKAGRIVNLPAAFDCFDATTRTPVIASVYPRFGNLGSEITVVMGGSDLKTVTQAFFGNILATVDASSPTSLTVIIPAQSTVTGTVGIKLVTASGAEAYRDDAFAFVPALNEVPSPWIDPHGLLIVDGDRPILASVDPANGSLLGGTEIIIDGWMLEEVISVSIGNTIITEFEEVDREYIKLVTPAGTLPGNVDLIVTTPSGTSNTLQFKYNNHTVSAISPNKVPLTGTASAIISGTGFRDGETTVYIGSQQATILALTSTSIQVQIPAVQEPGVLPVIVIVSDEVEGITNGLRYYGPNEFVFLSIAPNAGVDIGGETVTITGNALATATRVTFDHSGEGELDAPFTYDAASKALKVTTLNHRENNSRNSLRDPASVDVSIYAGGVKETLIKGFTYTRNTTFIVSSTTTSGPALGLTPSDSGAWIQSQFRITGDNIDRVRSVAFGNLPPILKAQFLSQDVEGLSLRLPANPNGNVPATVDVIVKLSDNSEVRLVNAFTWTKLEVRVDSLTPPSGLSFSTGGIEIAIAGANLGAVSKVFFDSAEATTFVSRTNTTLTVKLPASPVGPGVVDLRLELGQGLPDFIVSDAFEYLPVVVRVDSLTPPVGLISGGINIAIAGNDLLAVSKVFFDSAEATIAPGRTNTTLTVKLPASPVGPGMVDLRLVLGQGLPDYIVSDAFEYLPVVVPTITSVQNLAGPRSGGTPVSFIGTGLDVVTGVSFGTTDVAWPPVQKLPTLLMVVAPPAVVSGQVSLTLHYPGGELIAAQSFTYQDGGYVVAGYSPNHGPVSGKEISISGTGMDTIVSVLVDGVAIAPEPGATASTVKVDLPPHEVGTVTLAVSDGTTTTTIGTFTYEASTVGAPALSGISPVRGKLAGGDKVGIYGNHLSNVTSVTFGGIPVTRIVRSSNTLMEVITPAASVEGPVDITVSNGVQSATLHNVFTYVSKANPGGGPGVEPEALPLIGALGCSLAQSHGALPMLGLLVLVLGLRLRYGKRKA